MQTSPVPTNNSPLGARLFQSIAHVAQHQANEASTSTGDRLSTSSADHLDQSRIRVSNQLTSQEILEVADAATKVIESVGLLSPLSSGQFAQEAAQVTIDKLDADGDGRLTIEELPIGEKAFAAIDTDSTGSIGIEELTTAMHEEILGNGSIAATQPDAYAAAWLQAFGVLSDFANSDQLVESKLRITAPPRPVETAAPPVQISEPLQRGHLLEVESAANSTSAPLQSVSETGVLPPTNVFDRPDIDSHHAHLRDIAQAIAEKFQANGFADELPTNVTQLFESMKLNTGDRSFIMNLLSEHFPNGFGIDRSA